MGILAAVEGIATLSAPLLAGVIVESLGWRWCFYVNAPMGVATLLLTMYSFPDTQKPSDIAQMKLTQKIAQLAK